MKLHSAIPNNTVANFSLWLAMAILIGLKLCLVSDLSVQIAYFPHDDSLYVERAFHLLAGDAFGPYDSRILVKYPGISFWLAGMRFLGIPFLLSVNALYIGAGVYMIAALRACNTSRLVSLAAFTLYIFNPITLGYDWLRVIREPLATGLLVVIASAMAHLFAGQAAKKVPWPHVVILAIAFAFALYVREDDRLLWGLLALFLITMAWEARWTGRDRTFKVLFLAAAIAPVTLGLLTSWSYHAFVEHKYGLPILHEFSEGEFPRMMAAIRSVQSNKDNRMVMFTQEAMGKLRVEVPALAPVINRLPPPGSHTVSCQLHGVCSEWSNGWMPFWVRDEAYRAGLTPDLPAAQEYYRLIRESIEKACQQERLHCVPNGNGLVPPMELRWARAYVHEALKLIAMVLRPNANVVSAAPRLFSVPVALGRLFQEVTLTAHFDTELQSQAAKLPTGLTFNNPIAELRTIAVKPYQFCAAIVLVIAFALFAFRLWNCHRAPWSPLFAIVFVFGIYSIFRFTALAYVAVFMGSFESRMVFATHILCIALALPFLAEILRKPLTTHSPNKTDTME